MATVIYHSRAFSKLSIRPLGINGTERSTGTVEKATVFLWNRRSLCSLGAGLVTALPNPNTSFRFNFEVLR